MSIFSKNLTYLLFLITFSSCVNINDPEVVDFKIIDINKDSTNNLIVKTNVEIYNPSFLNLNTDELKINVFYDTVLLAHTLFDNQINITNQDTSNLETDFVINSSALKYFSNFQDSVLLKIIGYTKISFLNKKYFFSTDYSLSPNLEISKISNFLIDKFGLKISKIKFLNANIDEVNLNIGLSLENIDEFNLSINKLETFIYSDANHQDLLGVSILDTSRLNSFNNSSIVYSNVKLNSLKLTKLLFLNSLSGNNNLHVMINSIVDFDGINLPISINKEIHYNPLTFEAEIK
tara:strand:+ start:126 stop:998 length:873 start_codon:yes stop_codon:yes gene_type:complete